MMLALVGSLLIIETARQFPEASFEFIHGHVAGPEVDIEKRAKLPCPFAKDPILSQKPCVERRSRKGGLHRDLHFRQLGVEHESQHFVERVRSGAVEAEDEAAVDADPV